MSLQQKLQSEIKQAMINKDSERLSILRYLGSLLKQFEIDNRESPNDEQSCKILLKQVKLLKQAISKYEQANRTDLAENDYKQLSIIEEFLPKQLSALEVENIIKTTIKKLQITSVQELGKLMGVIKKEYGSSIDLSIAAKVAKETFE